MTAPLPIVVIGAGAAGLMAAIHAARAGARVVLLERTPDGGRKILISGGGRCNVLPVTAAPERFVSEAPPHLVRRLLAAWPLADQRRFFERDLGLPLTADEDTGKLFPASGRARDVRDALVRQAVACGVDLRFGVTVLDLAPEAGAWRIVLARGEVLGAGRVVLATGGLSVPRTGSDGFGLAAARRLGCRVRDTYPALTPLLADPPVHAELAGISLSVRLAAPGAPGPAESRGGFLFTHRGYSGPAVLDLSHLAVRSRLAGGVRQPLLVQWTEWDGDEWESRLTARSARTVLTVLREALPARLAGRLLADSGVDAACRLAELPREGRRRLVAAITRYPLPWTGDEGYRKAEVTGGGVALEEVEPGTLESRRVPGLHCCGELLDAFGPIGGHNFSWAWATGRAAGLGAARGAGDATSSA